MVLLLLLSSTLLSLTGVNSFVPALSENRVSQDIPWYPRKSDSHHWHENCQKLGYHLRHFWTYQWYVCQCFGFRMNGVFDIVLMFFLSGVYNPHGCWLYKKFHIEITGKIYERARSIGCINNIYICNGVADFTNWLLVAFLSLNLLHVAIMNFREYCRSGWS